jgi:hypothetical protein
MLKVEELRSWENPYVDLAPIEIGPEEFKFLEQTKDLLHRVKRMFEKK